MREIDELLALCRYAGSGLAMCQGAGGNVSIKTEDGAMWIKASGYRLSSVHEGAGYLLMKTPPRSGLKDSVDGLESGPANLSMSRYLQALVLDGKDLRPSLETWFHAILGRVVLHTHPIYANAFACMDGGFKALRSAIEGELVNVEYRTPGHQLGKAVQNALEEHCGAKAGRPAQFLLQNHGLIATAETPEESIRLSEELLRAGRAYFGDLPSGFLDLWIGNKRLSNWTAVFAKHLQRRGIDQVVRPARFARLYRNPHDPQCLPIVPDDVVCNGERLLKVDASDPMDDVIEQCAFPPRSSRCLLVRGLGIVFAAPAEPMTEAMEEQLLANLMVRELIARKGRCRELLPKDIDEISAMDSEKHRQQVLANGGSPCKS